MNKKLGLFLVLVLVLILATALVACSAKKGSDGQDLEIPDYVKPTLNATYGQTLANVALPEGFSWQAPLTTSVGNAGNNEFLVTFTPADTEKYQIITDIPVIIRVAKATYDMTGIVLNGGQFTYDGNAKSLAISGTLPEGVTVSYENNGKVDAGTYEVVAHFTGNSNYNDIPDLRANLVIIKADLTGLSFVDSTVTYNGQAQSITVSGLGEGMSVVYSMQDVAANANIQTNVGTYAITATVSKANFNSVILNATLTINKANITGVTFANAQVTYDGTEKSLLITGTLPEGVTVAYTGNTGTNVGEYPATATFTVTNPNYNALDAMQATLKIVKAIPQYANLVPDLIPIDVDNRQGNVYYFSPYYVEPGFEPRLYQTDPGHAEYASPLLGKNILYANYDLGSNYEVVENIPFTILGWDSDVYTVEASYNAQSYLSMIYDAQNQVTLRLVAPCSGPISWNAFRDMVDHDEIFVYAYSGQYTNDELLFDNSGNPIAPIAVYGIYQNDGLFNVGERIYDWNSNKYHGENEDDYIPKYVLSISSNTLVPYFFDAGELTYIYASEPDNMTLAFYTFEVENGPDEHYLFSYDGLYNSNTLPKVGTFEGTWDYEVNPYISANGFNYLFKLENNELNIETGDELYRFGYWDDVTYDGEYYVVLSFCDDEVVKNIYSYLFDEEVDITAANILNGKNPSLYCYTGWLPLTELGNTKPSAIDCEYFIFDSFDIGDNGELTANMSNRDWYWEGYDSSGNAMSIYFRVEDNKAYNFHSAKTLGEAQYWWNINNTNSSLGNYYLFLDPDIEWEENGPYINLYSPYLDSNGWPTCEFYFMKSTRNGGEIIRDVGDICWVIDQGSDTYTGMNRYLALTRWDASSTGTFVYFAESVEEVLSGRIEPIFGGKTEESYYWEEEGNMVYLSVEGSDWPYMKNADHTLTLRLGEIVGVLQNEEIDPGLYSWTVLTIDNGKKSAYEFYGASAEDIFDGDAYPIDIITYLRWRIEDGYVIMPGPGVDAVYTIDQNKVLSMYMGVVVDEFIDYEYVSEQDHTITGATRLTLNDVLGNHLGFMYNARVVNGEIVDWIIVANDIYKWVYNELGDFYSVDLFYRGDWNRFATYYAMGEGNERTLYDARFYIVSYGYVYDAEVGALLSGGGFEIYYCTWIVVLAADTHSPATMSFVYVYDGKKSLSNIPTYAQVLADTKDDASAEAAKVLEMINPDNSSWEMVDDCNFKNLGPEYDAYVLTIGTSDYYLFPLGSSFVTFPTGFEVAYLFDLEGAGAYSEFYLRNTQRGTSNIDGICEGLYDRNEILHVKAFDIDVDFYWTDVTVGDNKYLCYQSKGDTNIVGCRRITQNGLIEVPDTLVYKTVLEGNIWLFCTQDDVAFRVFVMTGSNHTDDEISSFIAGNAWDFAGIWSKDGKYILYLDVNYLCNGDDSNNCMFELDNNNALSVSTTEYYGTVKDILVVGSVGDEDTFIIVKEFGYINLYKYDGKLTTIAATQDIVDTGSFGEPVGATPLGGNLYLINGKVYDISSEHFVISNGTICYWMYEYDSLYLFMQYGEYTAILLALDSDHNNIASAPQSKETITYEYFGGYQGMWALSDDDDCDIINYMPGSSGGFPFYIVDEATGEVVFAAIP